jgi:hypothetical protein
MGKMLCLYGLGRHVEAVRGKTDDEIAEVADKAARRSGKSVWPAIQASAAPDALPAKEFRAAVQAATSGRSQGVIIFSFRDAAREGRLESLRASM